MRRLTPVDGPDSRAGAEPLTDRVSGMLARLGGDEPLDSAARAGLLSRLAVALAASARQAGAAAVASGRWLADVVADVAPMVPIRDLPTLRRHHGGLTGDDLAVAVVTAASRATAAVGAAGGALAAVEFSAPPLLLSAPLQLAAETLAVVGIELKLVAELHEVYGRPVTGTAAQRSAALVTAWVRRRGIDPFAPTGRLPGVVGGAARRELRQRLVRRVGRNVPTLAPFLAGALAGGELNRRETRKLGEAVARDLRR